MEDYFVIQNKDKNIFAILINEELAKDFVKIFPTFYYSKKEEMQKLEEGYEVYQKGKYLGCFSEMSYMSAIIYDEFKLKRL